MRSFTEQVHYLTTITPDYLSARQSAASSLQIRNEGTMEMWSTDHCHRGGDGPLHTDRCAGRTELGRSPRWPIPKVFDYCIPV